MAELKIIPNRLYLGCLWSKNGVWWTLNNSNYKSNKIISLEYMNEPANHDDKLRYFALKFFFLKLMVYGVWHY
jgi:hypothetical protein